MHITRWHIWWGKTPVLNGWVLLNPMGLWKITREHSWNRSIKVRTLHWNNMIRWNSFWLKKNIKIPLCVGKFFKIPVASNSKQISWFAKPMQWIKWEAFVDCVMDSVTSQETLTWQLQSQQWRIKLFLSQNSIEVCGIILKIILK
jgi:hypothetical protein